MPDDAPADHAELAARLRFSLDEPMRISGAALAQRREQYEAIRSSVGRMAIRVTPRLLPHIHASVRRACDNLLLPDEPLTYVTSDAEPNALVASSDARYVIILNSGLVELLEPAELSAIVGHEIGHATLRHAIETAETIEQRTFALERSRAQEISADRIGLIAAGDASHALRAELKVACGLSLRHLTPDLDAFIEQISTPPADEDAAWEAERTHPTLALRFWAQRAFAESDVYHRFLGQRGGRPFDEVEREIEERFHGVGASAAFRATSDHVHEALAWLGIIVVAQDGDFSDSDRKILVEFVGRIWADDAFAYARRHGMAAVERRAKETVAPLRFSNQRARRRIEDSLREMAERATAKERLDEALRVIAEAMSA